MPTLAGAYQTLLELGCEVTTSDGTLQIGVPERLRENDNQDLDARRAVHAASKAARLRPRRRRHALQAGTPLPDRPITVGGGVLRKEPLLT